MPRSATFRSPARRASRIRREGVCTFGALSAILLGSERYYIAVTQVNFDPTAAEIAEIAVLAARQVRRFGLTPKLAFLSYSNFRSADTATAREMREALAMFGAALRTSRRRAKCRGMRPYRGASATNTSPTRS